MESRTWWCVRVRVQVTTSHILPFPQTHKCLNVYFINRNDSVQSMWQQFHTSHSTAHVQLESIYQRVQFCRLRTVLRLPRFLINTLWTGDADLCLCITTVEDGWCTSAFLTHAWFPCTMHFNYAIHAAFLWMILLTDVYRNVTSLRNNDLW